MTYLTLEQKRRAERRLNYARRICQEWRTIQREGVLYGQSGPVTADEWRVEFRARVRHSLGDRGNYGIAEAAICHYARERAERAGVARHDYCRRHVGLARNASGPDASKVYKRVAKWRRIAAERNEGASK